MDKTKHQVLYSILIAPTADPDTRYRLRKYCDWLVESGTNWYQPDLAAYRDFMLARGNQHGEPLSAVTVRAHLSTIRTRYHKLIQDTGLIHDTTRSKDASTATDPNGTGTLISTLQIALDPARAAVPPISKKKKRRPILSPPQAIQLIKSPGVQTLFALRDTAILGLFLCTGMRALSLSALNVDDLYIIHDKKPCVRVLEDKQIRFIPYGDSMAIHTLVEKWLGAAGINEGAAFTSFWRGASRPRGRLGVRSLHYLVSRYPLCEENQPIRLTVGDLVRSGAHLRSNDNFHARLDHLVQQITLPVAPPTDTIRQRIEEKTGTQRGDPGSEQHQNDGWRNW